MAVSSIAARRAYGITIPSIATPTTTPTARVAEGSVKQVLPQPQAAAISARSSEAAATLSIGQNSSKELPKNVPPTVKSLLTGTEEDDTPLPSRAEVEGLARRYLKVMATKDTKSSTDEQVKKLADFYGASPDRTNRLAQLVSELERGQEGAAENGDVAVA